MTPDRNDTRKAIRDPSTSSSSSSSSRVSQVLRERESKCARRRRRRTPATASGGRTVVPNPTSVKSICVALQPLSPPHHTQPGATPFPSARPSGGEGLRVGVCEETGVCARRNRFRSLVGAGRPASPACFRRLASALQGGEATRPLVPLPTHGRLNSRTTEPALRRDPSERRGRRLSAMSRRRARGTPTRRFHPRR